jgi:amino acid adenylation domain-containing protein
MSPPADSKAPVISAVDYDPFAESTLDRIVPTTEPQREVWLAARLNRGATLAYNESVTMGLRGSAQIDALRGATEDLVRRHDALRSTFSPDGLTLCVSPPGPLDVPIIDFSALDAAERERRLEEIAIQEVEQPFDLEKGPLFRARIVRLGPQDQVVMITAHHIICDGWSYWVVVKELSALYATRVGRSAEPLPPANSFADYALEERRRADLPEFASDERYWLEQFATLPAPLDLPGDRSRPPLRTQRAGREDHVLDADLVAAIKRTGAKNGASLFVTLLASFSAFLYRLTRQTDVVVGIPAAGQSLAGHERLVGHCVNLLPLRSNVDPKQPFSALLKAMRGTMLGAYEHQGYTFGTLLKKLPLPRDPARLPLVSVVFNIDQALDSEKNSFPGLELDFASNPRRYENFELFINSVQVAGRMRFECQYNCDLFDATTIRRWLADFEVFLRDIVGNPERAIEKLEILSPADKEALDRLNTTTVDYPRDVPLAQLVEAQVERTPDAVAVVCGSESVSFSELNARANQLAHTLVAHGAGPDHLVGIFVERSVDMVVALLAVVKAGAAYLPLDSLLPPERLSYMLEDSKASLVVTQDSLRESLPAFAGTVVSLDEKSWKAKPRDSLAVAVQADNLAYVIYTSGSTGKPKGVEVPRGALTNLLWSMRGWLGLTAADRLLAITTISFDIAGVDMWLPLLVGARLVVASREEAVDGARLREHIDRHGITFLQATPVTWRLLLEAGWEGKSDLQIVCTGEAMPRDLAAALAPIVRRLWNLYGPTETTIWSTGYLVREGNQAVLIGRPVANTQCYFLDENRSPVPIGVVGELFIGGDGLARGYLRRPELTAEKFLPDPFRPQAGARMYRTGDLARYLADGNIECLGRTDFQVKLRGYRIEPGEIEAALTSHDSVKQATVIVREDRPGDVRLVAYVIPSESTIDDSVLRTHMRATLPEYMVPAHFIALESFPTTASGKIDRKALPAPDDSALVSPTTGRPATELEAQILASYEARLGRKGVGLFENFFDLGGHSLLAAQLIAGLNRDLGLSLPMRLAFEAPTAAELARRIEQNRGSTTGAGFARITNRADQRTAPLSLMQQRAWFIEQLRPGNIIFNTPAAHRLRGPMDEAAFERAFNEMVRRQPSLRTVIREKDGEAIQFVLPEIQVRLFPPEDLTSLPAEERESRLQTRIREMTVEVFDFHAGPLFRTRLFRLGEEEHVLVFVVHHLIWDGWSFDLFYEEMHGHYQAFRNGQPSPLEPLPVSYGDFAAWQREWLQGDTLRSEVEHWKAQLLDHDEALALPADRPRPAQMSGTGITEWINIPKEQTDQMRALGRQADATLFMTLLAAFYAFLWRHTGQNDLVVGTPVRGRSHIEVEKLMGFFVNALALRKNVDENLSFVDFTREVRAAVLDGFSHPDVPFEHLVRELKLPRDESRLPVYQAFFSFQDARQRPTHWGNLQHERFPVLQAGLAEDIGLWFVERPWGLIGGLSLNADIFAQATGRRYRDRFIRLVESILADPHKPLADLDLIGDDERRELEQGEASLS